MSIWDFHSFNPRVIFKTVRVIWHRYWPNRTDDSALALEAVCGSGVKSSSPVVMAVTGMRKTAHGVWPRVGRGCSLFPWYFHLLAVLETRLWKFCSPHKITIIFPTMGSVPWLTFPSWSPTPCSISSHITKIRKHKHPPAANSKRSLAYLIGFVSNLLLNFTRGSWSALLLILILFVLSFWVYRKIPSTLFVARDCINKMYHIPIITTLYHSHYAAPIGGLHF